MGADCYPTINEAIESFWDKFDIIDAECDEGGVLWSVVRVPEGALVFCNYIEPKQIEGSTWWAAYSISEMEGPYAVTCPIRILQLGTVEVQQDWRHHVRRYHEGLKRRWLGIE